MRQAFVDFGKGRHPAGLDFGECFSDALARALEQAPLSKGEELARTEVESAIWNASAHLWLKASDPPRPVDFRVSSAAISG